MLQDSDTPLVSIITPAYNAERFVADTVASVRSQTYPHWEMIIVDDCSRDGTRDVVRDLARDDERVTWAQLPTNSGPGPARNKALDLARGRYLAFRDADDLWDPEKLEKQLAFMRNGRYALTYTSYRVISETGEVTGRIGRVPAWQDYTDMLKNTAVGCLTVMIDREDLPPFRFPDLRTGQDGAAWLSLLRCGIRAYGMPDELASYRIVRTSNTRNKLKSAKGVWKLMRQHEQLSVPWASWFFAHYAWNAAKKTIATRGW